MVFEVFCERINKKAMFSKTTKQEIENEFYNVQALKRELCLKTKINHWVKNHLSDYEQKCNDPKTDFQRPAQRPKAKQHKG